MWKVTGHILRRRAISVSVSSWGRRAVVDCSSASPCCKPITSSFSTTQQTSQPTSTVSANSYIKAPSDDVKGYLGKILNSKVYEVAIETELQHAKNLSNLLDNTIFLKREDTQPVFSFKIRGAYNKMASLPHTALSRGVVACSAGNHAQGVALSARKLNCRAVICMPLATPSIKVNAVRTHGGETVEVRLVGNNYDEAAAEAKRLEIEEGLAMIHPFDDEFVIAGQGTIGTFHSVTMFIHSVCLFVCLLVCFSILIAPDTLDVY